MSAVHLDSSRTPADRAAALLPLLSLDDKLAQLTCYFAADPADTAAFVARHPHGVGQISCLEARMATSLDDLAADLTRLQQAAMAANEHRIPATLHMEGVCGAYAPGATSFPTNIARAASFDADLEAEIGQVVGRQERALGVTQTFAPVLDVSREPRFGRHGESYGEDATLAAALGSAFTRGVQDDDGSGRRTDAVAKHFVGSHHVTGGIHGAHLEASWRTLVEYYAKPFQAAITLAGLRGIMPSYNVVDGTPASASRRLLTTLLREEMGFDGQVVSDYGAVGQIHHLHHLAASFETAGLRALAAGMDAELHVPEAYGAVLADAFASGRADVALLDRAVRNVLTAKFRMGLFEDPFPRTGAALHRDFGREADAAVSLRSARESLVLLRNGRVLPLAPGVRRVAVIGCHADEARFFFGGYTHLSMAEAMLSANASIAGVGAGENKALERTIPGTQIQPDDGPAFDALRERLYPGMRSLRAELAARLPDAEVAWAYGYPAAGPDESGHDEALALAESADVVILTLGGKHGTASIASMGEGVDATDINLPPCQESFIEKVAALGRPLVGVHLDGRPVSSDAADAHLGALLEAWNPAEHGAKAIVDVLLGVADPGGRLPVTVARNAGQVPVYHNHPRGSMWHQGESIGFADYVDCSHTPRYPFGHGLSFTTFDYADLRVSVPEMSEGNSVDVTVRVTNSGDRPGTEVVQLYASDRYASVSRPVQELAGFARVELAAGESADVTFTLAATQFAFLDAHLRWVVEAGEIDLRIGASSEDIRLVGDVRIAADAQIEGRTRGFVAATRVSR